MRRQTPEDDVAVRNVNEQAFDGPPEANLVEAIRNRGADTLSLVAVRDATVVGHILFSPVDIVSARSKLKGVALGPMAVLPAHQRRGIGTRLVQQGLDMLRDDGPGVVVVLGHPQFYPRFGFAPASGFSVQCPYDVPAEVFMLLEFREGVLKGQGGTVRYQPEFDDV